MKKFLSLIILSTVLLGCESSELHKSMESMGDAFKAMKESDDLSIIKKEFSAFKSALEIAKRQPVAAEDQNSFDEGLDKLTDISLQLEVALAADDLDAATSLIQKLGKTRKEYHEKLGVK